MTSDILVDGPWVAIYRCITLADVYITSEHQLNRYMKSHPKSGKKISASPLYMVILSMTEIFSTFAESSLGKFWVDRIIEGKDGLRLWPIARYGVL